MIAIENARVSGFEEAIRGMRNPKNSWDKSDSYMCDKDCRECEKAVYKTQFVMGPNDKKLAETLAHAGPVHGKFLRMITVWADVTAPLYWWKEYDTYKIGTVANSCSTMHTIHEVDLVASDFSTEHLSDDTKAAFCDLLNAINKDRRAFVETKDKERWYSMIQALPMGFMQKRTVMLNYEVLRNMYEYRKDHKQQEWRDFCAWIADLPYSDLITKNWHE